MIYNLSKRIAFYFVEKGVIAQNEVDIYRFGIETVLCTLVDIVIALATGALFRKIWYALFFLIVFAILRQFVEGYHAKTFWGCKCMMLVMMLLVMSIEPYLESEVAFFLGIVSVFLLIWVCETGCRKELLTMTFLMGVGAFYYCEKRLAALVIVAFIIVLFAAFINKKGKGGGLNE